MCWDYEETADGGLYQRFFCYWVGICVLVGFVGFYGIGCSWFVEGGKREAEEYYWFVREFALLLFRSLRCFLGIGVRRLCLLRGRFFRGLRVRGVGLYRRIGWLFFGHLRCLNRRW